MPPPPQKNKSGKVKQRGLTKVKRGRKREKWTKISKFGAFLLPVWVYIPFLPPPLPSNLTSEYAPGYLEPGNLRGRWLQQVVCGSGGRQSALSVLLTRGAHPDPGMLVGSGSGKIHMESTRIWSEHTDPDLQSL